MPMCMRTVVEVELCYGQQHSGIWQLWAETTKESLYARERSVDQWHVLNAHTVQDAHSFHQTLKEEMGQKGSSRNLLQCDVCITLEMVSLSLSLSDVIRFSNVCRMCLVNNLQSCKFHHPFESLIHISLPVLFWHASLYLHLTMNRSQAEVLPICTVFENRTPGGALYYHNPASPKRNNSVKSIDTLPLIFSIKRKWDCFSAGYLKVIRTHTLHFTNWTMRYALLVIINNTHSPFFAVLYLSSCVPLMEI